MLRWRGTHSTQPRPPTPAAAVLYRSTVQLTIVLRAVPFTFMMHLLVAGFGPTGGPPPDFIGLVAAPPRAEAISALVSRLHAYVPSSPFEALGGFGFVAAATAAPPLLTIAAPITHATITHVTKERFEGFICTRPPPPVALRLTLLRHKPYDPAVTGRIVDGSGVGVGVGRVRRIAIAALVITGIALVVSSCEQGGDSSSLGREEPTFCDKAKALQDSIRGKTRPRHRTSSTVWCTPSTT